MQAVRAMAASAIVVACGGTAVAGSAPDAGRPDEPLAHFRHAVEAYMNLHDSVKRSLPPLDGSADAIRINATMEAMARGMRAARANAEEGEVFGNEAGTVLRGVILDVLRDKDCDAARKAAVERDDGERAVPRPLVHDEFVWARGSSMPSCILGALPEMPEELQFRFVGRDLVIVDLHSNLIVDVLPDALPADESWRGVRYTAARPTGGLYDHLQDAFL